MLPNPPRIPAFRMRISTKLPAAAGVLHRMGCKFRERFSASQCSTNVPLSDAQALFAQGCIFLFDEAPELFFTVKLGDKGKALQVSIIRVKHLVLAASAL